MNDKKQTGIFSDANDIISLPRSFKGSIASLGNCSIEVHGKMDYTLR
jgi:hypothetical protein